MVFGSSLLFSQTLAAAWHTTEVGALLAPGQYLSAERWRLSSVGVEVFTEESCFSAKRDWFLQQSLLEYPIKVQFPDNYHPRRLYRPAYIKLDNSQLLGEFLLEQGWAQVNEDDHLYQKRYESAQRQAQQAKKGLWGECDTWYHLREEQRLNGRTPYTPQSYKVHLKSGSGGWVQAVLSPTTLQLQDGTKVQLQGLKVPSETSPLQQCWQEQFTKHLSNTLVGQPVLLEADQLQLTSHDRALQRYLFLPGSRYHAPTLLNAWLIQAGWAQLDESQLHLKYVDQMHAAEDKRLSSSVPPAWWGQCVQTVLDSAQAETAPQRHVEYDADCPIKGNIAGSKKNPKKTYHTPLSGWYKRIEPEACFESEDKAEAAGFSKVK